MNKYWLLFLLVYASSLSAQNLIINEVMASNKTTIYDEDGDSSDWIELYNKGNEQISLTGYSLSDDTLKTNKWIFGNTIIKPGEHLVVFASGKDRNTSYLHTNFNVSALGESVILCDSKGIISDRVNVPISQSDISYGRESDGAVKWIFQSASPGLANTGKANAGLADNISASLPGGFYPATISVSLSAGDSKIYYTLDGNDPDSTSSQYSSPISITKTSVLKAVSLKKGYSPGQLLYQSYFINETTNLPVISLSSDPYNLFDKNYGIYTNYKKDWERPAHIEFFDDSKKPGFSKDCVINIHGQQSAEWAQKSLGVKFKDGIDALEYPLFPGFPVTTFKSFVLRNSGNDFQYTHIRDAMMQTLVKDLDIDYQEYRPVASFINGEYWGIYNIREKIDEHYIANRHGVDPDSIDLLENNMNVVHGDSLHYLQLINYISKANMAAQEAYDYVDRMINMDECILYFAAQAYYDNLDWPGTNIKFWRERNATGKWRWILYDLDFGFGLYAHGPSEDHISFMFSTVETRYSNPPWSTLLQRKLVENPTIRNRFINQIADLLNTNFKSERVVDTINSIANHIAGEITKHRKRWNIAGEGLTKLISFANERPTYLRTHVRNFFKSGSDGLITINSTAGGRVKLNSLFFEKANLPWTGVYFQSNAVHLKAIPLPGFKFTGWGGDITSTSDTISLFVGRGTNVFATFSADSSDIKGIVINEINYNSSTQFDPGDWIEIYNKSNQSIDISNWIVSDSDPSHSFTFPSGTVLEADKYLVVVGDSKAFTTLFPSVKNYIGQMDFGLSGSGEQITLTDEDKNVIDSLVYDEKSPWPTDANGLGATIELKDPTVDNSFGKYWKASFGHGSPGKINSVRTSVSEKNNIIPNMFMLYQNYPNPFNPETIISYKVQAASQVSLKVYDVLGRETATIVDEYKQAGNYNVKFNVKTRYGASLQSGIYFYKLQAGSFIQTKKMVLLK
ncbi:MAG: CotH kinase family protein [Ignavibacteria bacterium]|nr:CotH kinase family protein [Ignavibacteria bacterium]